MLLLDIDIETRVIIGISAMLVLFAGFIIVFINNQRKKLQYHRDLHALYEKQQQILTDQNILLEKRVLERTLELSHQKDELQKSLHELRSAQLQLVQKEKMASLGELTAGIAHEIQNPLNFVNNFSDLNRELVADMKQEIDEANFEEVKAIADEIDKNEQKINHHGKRADAIVKGMLQHSQGGTGNKELVDINNLVEEYLRLSYYGLHGKDNISMQQ
jgi:C4-dicarboxylate-specific signal transduction histidine kinase